MTNKYQKSLDNLCKNCQSLMSQISVPIREGEISNANCGHQLCPYRHIDNSYCEDYTTLQELITNSTEMEEGLNKAHKFNDDLMEQLSKYEKALDDVCYELAYREYNNDSSGVQIEYHAHKYREKYLGELNNGK